MNFVKIFLLLVIGQNLVESFGLGAIKRGGSEPFRPFLLARQFAHLQKRLQYERMVTITQRLRLHRNGPISRENGQVAKSRSAGRNQSNRNTSRVKMLRDFHKLSSTFNKITDA